MKLKIFESIKQIVWDVEVLIEWRYAYAIEKNCQLYIWQSMIIQTVQRIHKIKNQENNPNEKWVKELNRVLSEEIQLTDKYFQKCSIFSVMGKIKIKITTVKETNNKRV